MSDRKVGLALGGGAARGWAHIGVIQGLEDCGIEIGCVSGTSIGALVGSVYASGNLEGLKQAVLEIDRKKIISLLDVVFPKNGLLDGKKVTDFFRAYVSGEDFSSLNIPFGAVVTDLQTSEEIWLTTGDVSRAVRASFAVPGLFTPIMIDDRFVVDGGLVDPLPVSLARSMGADIVIAVDLNYYLASRWKNLCRPKQNAGEKEECAPAETTRAEYSSSPGKEGLLPDIMERLGRLDISWLDYFKNWRNKPLGPNIFEIIFASTLVMEKTITQLKLEREPADMLIRPELGKIRFMDFHRAKESISEGYDAAISAVISSEKNRNLLGISKSRAEKLKSKITLQK
ncbi:MAG: patatin-like phospholipase family protein [Desulfonatronovibrio sp.]